MALEQEPHRFDLEGSELSVPAGSGRAYLSVQRRHWGPSWTGSLLLDGAARAIPGLGWRQPRATPSESPWLSWLGPWRVDAFVGQLTNDGGPGRVKLLAARLDLQPWPGLQIGLSRVMQWGGAGRPESLKTLFDGLLGRDNIDGPDHSQEPGNQLGGADARLTLRTDDRVAVSVYGQAIGEDEAGMLPSRYLGSAGVDIAGPLEAGASLRAFAELANTVAGGAFGRPSLGAAYRHPMYPAGYTQRGSPLGHPAGGDVRVGSAGALVEGNGSAALLMVHHGSVAAPTAQFPTTGRISGLSADCIAETAARLHRGPVARPLARRGRCSLRRASAVDAAAALSRTTRCVRSAWRAGSS